MVTIPDGTTTADGTEQTLWDITSTKSFGGMLFCHNMVASDILVIKVYIRDENQGTTMRKVYEETLNDAQDPESFVIPTIPAGKHKVTIQQTGGTNRVYTWYRAEY